MAVPVTAVFRRAVATLRFVWDAGWVAVIIAGLVTLARSTLPNATDRGDPTSHPYTGQAWFPGYRRELTESLRMRWSPYVYWQRHPYTGRYINVDSGGYRATVQANTASPTREVWFFGGSTMWGTWQRDSMTVPSQVARALAVRGITDVAIRNFGETGYVSTQEYIRLSLELRGGGRPAVVVFGDGTADLAAAAESGACAAPQNEDRRRIEFAIGRLLTQRTPRELVELIRVVRGHLDKSNGVPQLRTKADEYATDLRPLERHVLACYAGTMQLIEHLGRDHGFVPLYFWLPSPVTSRRLLTRFELAVVDTMRMADQYPYVRVLTRLAASDVDSLLGPRAPGRFHNLAHVFDGDTATVFMDYVGHVTERAAGREAEAMAGPIADALRSARAQNWK